MGAVKRAIVGAAILTCAGFCLGSNRIHSLYTDHRAMRVDDILTIYVEEDASADAKSGTATSKENSVAWLRPASPALKALPNW